MSSTSKIEWTEQTWNPATGCTKVSPGCKNCYAEGMAYRLKAMGTAGYDNGFKLSLMPERLQQPVKRKKPTMYFVNSMSDLFHEDIPFGYLDQVFEVINQTPQHTYQILTKRAPRMREYFDTRPVPINAWLGVTVEDKAYGLPRIDELRNIRASTRFLSVEPLLEDLGENLDFSNIHWVIVGGESGQKSRVMEMEWVDNIHKYCKMHNTPFFFKQWGGWGSDGKRRSKKANGRQYKGTTWDEMPELSVGD